MESPSYLTSQLLQDPAPSAEISTKSDFIKQPTLPLHLSPTNLSQTSILPKSNTCAATCSLYPATPKYWSNLHGITTTASSSTELIQSFASASSLSSLTDNQSTQDTVSPDSDSLEASLSRFNSMNTSPTEFTGYEYFLPYFNQHILHSFNDLAEPIPTTMASTSSLPFDAYHSSDAITQTSMIDGSTATLTSLSPSYPPSNYLSPHLQTAVSSIDQIKNSSLACTPGGSNISDQTTGLLVTKEKNSCESSVQNWNILPVSTNSNEVSAIPAQAKVSTLVNTYANHPPSQYQLRRDGIPRKNARFEIPAERTLSNIDFLIAQSRNEEERKELKAQKRLLRNRQAALDSRQRKKRHTEELEEEKKIWTEKAQQLKEELARLQAREEECKVERQQWLFERSALTDQLTSAQCEKDELIHNHLLERQKLQKRILFLMQKLSSAYGKITVESEDALNLESSTLPSVNLADNASIQTNLCWNPRIFDLTSTSPSSVEYTDPDKVKILSPAFFSMSEQISAYTKSGGAEYSQQLQDSAKLARIRCLVMMVFLSGVLMIGSAPEESSAVSLIRTFPRQIRHASRKILELIFHEAKSSSESIQGQKINVSSMSSPAEATNISEKREHTVKQDYRPTNITSLAPSVRSKCERFMGVEYTSVADYSPSTASSTFSSSPASLSSSSFSAMKGEKEIQTTNLSSDQIPTLVIDENSVFHSAETDPSSALPLNDQTPKSNQHLVNEISKMVSSQSEEEKETIETLLYRELTDDELGSFLTTLERDFLATDLRCKTTSEFLLTTIMRAFISRNRAKLQDP